MKRAQQGAQGPPGMDGMDGMDGDGGYAFRRHTSCWILAFAAAHTANFRSITKWQQTRIFASVRWR